MSGWLDRLLGPLGGLHSTDFLSLGGDGDGDGDSDGGYEWLQLHTFRR